jgi:uncharacterized protein YndB with AHSA1/START domain
VPSDRILIDAPPEVVFAVLLDPAAYAYWVVGTKIIRSVDAGWPAPGTSFHHTVGIGPFSIHDSTTVLAVQPPHLLDLRVRFRPIGEGTAQVRLETVGDHRATLLSLAEAPEGGWAERFWALPVDHLVGLRNRWSIRRLRRLAIQRLDVLDPSDRQSAGTGP